MSREILYPSTVKAYRYGNEPEVTIVASGYEDGFQKIQIEASLAQIYPPIYMVTGEPSDAIGDFPYTVQKTVQYATDLDYVSFQMEGGTQRITIENIFESKATPEALTATQSNQVTGIAPNSSDINKAISNAVSKLYKLYPGKINAKMVDSGFVAAGSPIGIAYYYVVMEQQS
ncbi:MAG: hypothetical protein P8P74_01055 [Crocinitomicaceae bacterium]|nr:hypothetical protein [Crocinitomicaceae bacterium]